VPDPKQIPGLNAALAAVRPSPLRSLLERTAVHLPWRISDTNVPESFSGRSASAEIAGPDGLVPSQDLRFGLFWQSPETFYPPHSHAAEEFYFVLSGSPLWQKDEAPFEGIAPNTLVHHEPYQRHAMRTARDGLLAMWIWTGDLSFSSYRFHES
jgi:mannose-6-phosphate isomerase-like protein (cupin superfamily)